MDTCYGRIRFNDQNHKENQIERGGLNPGGSSGLSGVRDSTTPFFKGEYMTWTSILSICSAVPAAGSWETSCWGIPPSELSRLKSIRERYYSSDKEMESCHPSQSGMMCELFDLITRRPRTSSNGSEVSPASSLSPVDSRVPTYHVPEKVKGSPEKNPDSGPKWPGSLAKYDPDTRSWKTHQYLLLGGLEPYSETFPKWGIMRDGELLEQTMPGLLTGGKGSGLWPTPRAGKTTDEKEETWRKRKDRGGVSTPPLTLAVKMYPTPSARDWKDSPGISKTGTNPDGTTKTRNDQLARRVYPTPTSSAGGPEPEGKTGRKLTTVIMNNHEQDNDAIKTTVGQLNPDWVEFLMNWPIKWTSLSPIKLDWRTWYTDPADTGEIPRVATGIKNRVNRLKAIGNGQVPAAMVLAWKILTGENQ